ncbi:hypothetical protein [Companilactobacillus ginsenosidimutans]|uniref:DUF4352 domain-containing protein n=1 Tax=Companilactobacillus ginsenosidimutans TaxID=1007676 RepID=A0A0H4QI98_9LACO|nr:hypothetical protein [Companilactobacillus ginsenosidimutans]AKP67667.1 hypothetical protein ABM34_09095 [Companilactobacillus ginsenosidimutans]
MKKLIWFVGMLSIVLLAGCSNNNSNSSNDSATKTTKTEEATAYQKLSSNAQKSIKFKVIKGEENSNKNYSLSLKIQNKGNKAVKFDKSKFMLTVDGVKKFSSSADGNVTVKAGNYLTVDDLFENVSAEKLDGVKVQIAYLNKDDVVASPKLETSSDNDTDSNSDDSAATTQDSNSDQNSGQDNSSANAAPDTSNRRIADTNAAADRFRRAHGDWTADDIQATDNGSGYTITVNGESGGTVGYNGDATDQDGNYSSQADEDRINNSGY